MIVANRIDEVDLDAHAARIRRQDRVATGILTAIVAFVLAFLAAIVAFIVFQGIGKALSPGFLTTPPAADVNPGISSELFDSFYMLLDHAAHLAFPSAWAPPSSWWSTRPTTG